MFEVLLFILLIYYFIFNFFCCCFYLFIQTRFINKLFRCYLCITYITCKRIITRCGEIFIFDIFYFCIIISFLRAVAVVAKLVILVIPPLTSFILALKAELDAKLEKLGILPLTSFTLALRAVLVAVAKLVTLDILSSIFLILALKISF